MTKKTILKYALIFLIPGGGFIVAALLLKAYAEKRKASANGRPPSKFPCW